MNSISTSRSSNPRLLRRMLFSCMVILLTISACTAIPKAPLKSGDAIAIGDGTEDIVLDDFGPEPKLYISCDDRRHGTDAQFGAIVSYHIPEGNLHQGKIDTMPIHEYPYGLNFRPHGLDLQQVGPRLNLFVVCHDDTAGHHWIADFQVVDGSLYWRQNFHSGALVSPNGVTALPDGSLYVTNDHRERGSLPEAFFKKKVATIIRFDPDGSSKIAFTGIGYGNGITHKNGYVYVAATTENAIYRFKVEPDGMLSEQTCIAKVKGPDNLRWDGDDLIVACHLRLLKFLKHSKNPRKHSPTVVYRIRPGSAEPIPIFTDKTGKIISAGSTGLIYGNMLYIGQVFENWILAVSAGQNR